LLGLRQFGLSHLVGHYLAVKLEKTSQKANWARRPLTERMERYARDDTRFLKPLADQLKLELQQKGRLAWHEEACARLIDESTRLRPADLDSVWRVKGSHALSRRALAVLRELWQWREAEAEAVDRPAFHILQNEELLRSAEAFIAGSVPDYHHFSERRRRAFREAADKALRLPESEWPTWRRRFGTRPTDEMVRRTDQLRQRRDHAAHTLKMEPAFIAPRAALEAIATQRARAETLLVPWQRELLDL
jgi:ribonuclease D